MKNIKHSHFLALEQSKLGCSIVEYNNGDVTVIQTGGRVAMKKAIAILSVDNNLPYYNRKPTKEYVLCSHKN